MRNYYYNLFNGMITGPHLPIKIEQEEVQSRDVLATNPVTWQPKWTQSRFLCRPHPTSVTKDKR